MSVRRRLITSLGAVFDLLKALLLSMERLELLQRQIGELAAVQAMFVEPGEFVLEGSELRALEIAQQLTQGDAEESSPNQGLQLGGQVTLLNLQLNGSPVGLHFTLPPAYPLVAPQLQVSLCELGASCSGSNMISADCQHCLCAWVCLYQKVLLLAS